MVKIFFSPFCSESRLTRTLWEQETPQNPWGRGWSWFKRFRRTGGAHVAHMVGHKFEDRVAKHFRVAGKWNVRQSVILTDRFGDKSEIDVVYGWYWKHYIECKTYSSKLVPLSDVAKFKEVLQLNKIPIERSVFTSLCFSATWANLKIKNWRYKMETEELWSQLEIMPLVAETSASNVGMEEIFKSKSESGSGFVVSNLASHKD